MNCSKSTFTKWHFTQDWLFDTSAAGENITPESSTFTFKSVSHPKCYLQLDGCSSASNSLSSNIHSQVIHKCQVQIGLKTKSNHHNLTSFTQFGGNWCPGCQRLPEIAQDSHQILSVRSLYLAFLGLNQTLANSDMMYRLETKYRRRSTYFRQNLSLPIFVFAKMLNSWAEIFWRCHLLLREIGFLLPPPPSSGTKTSTFRSGKGKQYRAPSHQNLN